MNKAGPPSVPNQTDRSYLTRGFELAAQKDPPKEKMFGDSTWFSIVPLLPHSNHRCKLLSYTWSSPNFYNSETLPASATNPNSSLCLIQHPTIFREAMLDSMSKIRHNSLSLRIHIIVSFSFLNYYHILNLKKYDESHDFKQSKEIMNEILKTTLNTSCLTFPVTLILSLSMTVSMLSQRGSINKCLPTAFIAA